MLLSRARDGRWQGVDIATKARGAGGILQRSGSEATCCPALVELSALILGGQVSQPSDVTLWLLPPMGLSCELYADQNKYPLLQTANHRSKLIAPKSSLMNQSFIRASLQEDGQLVAGHTTEENVRLPSLEWLTLSYPQDQEANSLEDGVHSRCSRVSPWLLRRWTTREFLQSRVPQSPRHPQASPWLSSSPWLQLLPRP